MTDECISPLRRLKRQAQSASAVIAVGCSNQPGSRRACGSEVCYRLPPGAMTLPPSVRNGSAETLARRAALQLSA
jgi:hypothetical protein